MVYAEVMLPEHAPPEYADRSVLWNSVEWSETKRNAQPARTVELALSAELTYEQNIAHIRRFVQETFVGRALEVIKRRFIRKKWSQAGKDER